MMDPKSSTFCVDFLSQFPLIKAETINTLCFNGFTSFQQLAQLDDSDLPFLRDISFDQKSAVKRALSRFVDQANSERGHGVTIVSGQLSGNGARRASSDAVDGDDAVAGTACEDQKGTIANTSSSLVLNGGNTRHGSSNGTIARAGNSAPNSFYSINESSSTVVDVSDGSTAAAAPLDGSRSSPGGQIVGHSSIVSHFDNSVSAAGNCEAVSGSGGKCALANGTECHSCPRQAKEASVSNRSTESSATRRSTGQVIAAAGTAGAPALTAETQATARLILLAGKNNSSSTSSIYQQIDQFDLPASEINNNHDGSGTVNKCANSKLGEADNNNLSSAPNGSWSKRRKQNETVTAAVNSATLSSPSSTSLPQPSSSPSSSPSQPSSSVETLYSEVHSEPSDLEKNLTGESANSDESTIVYKRPKRLIRVNTGTQSSAAVHVICSHSSTPLTSAPHLSPTPVCTVQSLGRSIFGPLDLSLPSSPTSPISPTSPTESLRHVNELLPGTIALDDPVHYSLVRHDEDTAPLTLDTASLMPYAILEQLDCTKKLENGQKPLLYHFGTAENSDSKKEVINDSGRSMSALGEVNYLVTSNKLNSPTGAAVPHFEGLSSSNLNLIIDSAQLSSYTGAKSPSVATSNSTSAVASINSSICSTSVSGSGVTATSGVTGQPSTIAITSASPARGTLLNALHMPSNAVVSSENAILQSVPPLNALSDPMAIRDYLNEINVVPVSHSGLVDSSGALQVASFLHPSEHHQLVKNGNIIIDQSQSLDPNQLGNYVYNTLHLQLAAPDSTKVGQEGDKSPTTSLFTLGPANLQPATLSPAEQTPIGQQVANAVQQQQQQQLQQQAQQSPSNAASRRGRGRPKKYSDPLSMAVEQCLENSNSPTSQTMTGMTAFSGTILTTSGVPTIHICRWQGCGFSSMDILEFRNHNRTQHRDESTIIPSRKGKSAAPKEPLVCEVPGCGYSPKYRRLLIDHQNAHKGLRAHKCCFCEYNSSYFGDIRKHMIKKHPDLAQEIKVSKLKLKQTGLDGKGGKLTKAELDELTGTAPPKQPRSKKAKAAASGESGLDNGGTVKKRNYAKKSRKKKGDSETTQTTAFDGTGLGDGKALGLTGALQQSNAQASYGFMTATQGYGQLQPEHLVSNSYSSALNAGIMPQTAIIYLQTGPNGQTVQLAANDVNTLNQLIGYDINSLNGQIAMASGHPQVSNLGTPFGTTATSQVTHMQSGQSERALHQSNGLLCLDGSTAGSALTFLSDQQQSHQSAGPLYKCDYPLCYFQSEQYEAVLLHKHRDHVQGQMHSSQGQQHQQQQITIIDASTLTAMTGNQAQGSQQQISSHGHHQLTSANTNVVSSPVYALAPTNSVTTANFVHGLDYGSMTTTTAANQVTSAASLNPSSSSGSNGTSQVSGPNGSVNPSSGTGHLLDVSGMQSAAVANMIFAGDPNTLFFNTIGEHPQSHGAQQLVTTLNGNGMLGGTLVAVSSASSSLTPSSAVSTTSLVAAAVASAGLSESSPPK